MLCKIRIIPNSFERIIVRESKYTPRVPTFYSQFLFEQKSQP